MDSKRNLRNQDKALLRRIQRQMDVKKRESPIVKSEDYLFLEYLKEKLTEEPKRESRLSLFVNRKGFR